VRVPFPADWSQALLSLDANPHDHDASPDVHDTDSRNRPPPVLYHATC